MAFRFLVQFDQLKAGEPHPFRVEEQDLVLCRVGDEVYALDGICPHVGGPLGQGALHGYMLVCPWHTWEFDCRTGEHDRLRGCRLATYPVEVRGGEVFVDA